MALFDATPVDECRAFDYRLIHFWIALLEGGSVLQLQGHDLTAFGVHAGHLGGRIIQACHAVNPRVHIPAVEGWKAEGRGENRVKTRPVGDELQVDFYKCAKHRSKQNLSAEQPTLAADRSWPNAEANAGSLGAVCKRAIGFGSFNCQYGCRDNDSRSCRSASASRTSSTPSPER